MTIRIFKPGEDAAVAETVTDAAGNFLIRYPAMFGRFPYETHVTACGPTINIRPMVARLGVAEANCRPDGACHGPGGAQGAVFFSD